VRPTAIWLAHLYGELTAINNLNNVIFTAYAYGFFSYFAGLFSQEAPTAP
jgi:hypothetical protein